MVQGGAPPCVSTCQSVACSVVRHGPAANNAGADSPPDVILASIIALPLSLRAACNCCRPHIARLNPSLALVQRSSRPDLRTALLWQRHPSETSTFGTLRRRPTFATATGYIYPECHTLAPPHPRTRPCPPTQHLRPPELCLATLFARSPLTATSLAHHDVPRVSYTRPDHAQGSYTVS